MENDNSVEKEDIKVEEASTDMATSKNKITPMIVVLVILFAIVGIYLMNKGKKNETSSTSMQTNQEESVMAPTDSGIVITGGNYSFTPNEIKVKKGDKVTITFKNSEGMHDFMLDEFNVKTNVIGEGKEETVSFTPDRVGTFEFYCSVGSHRKMGMVGKLIVE